jgi:hypothetical protein
MVIKLNWVVLAYNYNLLNRMLITCESSICAFLLSALLQPYPYYYGQHIIYFSHLISINHKRIQPF